MRLIPVIDLLDGKAVHAIRGQRKQYRPVRSILCNTADPLAIASAFHEELGLNEIYIADLDAIQGFDRIRHRKIIDALARDEQLNLIVDAGISDIDDIRALHDMGIRKAVVGAETLPSWNCLHEIPQKIEGGRLIFSLDMRAGKVLSGCPELRELSPLELLEPLHSAGWLEVLLLDLQRVGSGEGIDPVLISGAKNRVPALHLLVGGGISGPRELEELKALNVSGALIATAFHNGKIKARHIQELLGEYR
jgi:phosphoribosylformimino-5-aminoimidazole carboxamide ribotide isomerase